MSTQSDAFRVKHGLDVNGEAKATTFRGDGENITGVVHGTINIQVVTALPPTPAANTLYIVTA